MILRPMRRRRSRAGPYDGVPPHLAPSIRDWIEDNVKLLSPTTTSRPGRFMLSNNLDPHADLVRAVERDVAQGSFAAGAHTVGTDQFSVSSYVTSLQRLVLRTDADAELALDVVHTLVGFLNEAGSAPCAAQVKELEYILESGQSVWMVGDIGGGGSGLVERLDPTVAARAETTIATGTNAAQYLREAWTEIRSRHPNYDLALDHANKALEAATQPIVSPNNPSPTLGTVIADLKNKPSKWTCTLGTVEQLVDRLQNIWKAQYRHGEAAGPIPNVDPGTARAAIHDAVTLVEWFQSGLVRAASS